MAPGATPLDVKALQCWERQQSQGSLRQRRVQLETLVQLSFSLSFLFFCFFF